MARSSRDRTAGIVIRRITLKRRKLLSCLATLSIFHSNAKVSDNLMVNALEIFISLKFTVCYTFSLHFITASIKFANDSTVWSLIL